MVLSLQARRLENGVLEDSGSTEPVMMKGGETEAVERAIAAEDAVLEAAGE